MQIHTKIYSKCVLGIVGWYCQFRKKKKTLNQLGKAAQLIKLRQ